MGLNLLIKDAMQKWSCVYKSCRVCNCEFLQMTLMLTLEASYHISAMLSYAVQQEVRTN